MSLSKKDYLETIKTMEISDGGIFNDQDSGIIKINIVGMKMQQQEKQISLKSIYDLVITIKNDVDILKQDNKEIKQDIKIVNKRIDNIETNIKEIKALPTITKELRQNKIL